MPYSIGKVADAAKVTVRTLHHYDAIGLLSPSQRTATGYRRYTDADLERLQQVLGYREVGFGLDDIKAILDAPGSDPAAHMRRQHSLLRKRIERLTRMAEALEYMMEAQQMGLSLTPEERFEVFGDADPARYEEETERRWGDTDAYKQSRRRAAAYTKEDWQRIKAEAAEIPERLAALMAAGEPADGTAAMDLAEEHRRHITRWFYDCGYDIHTSLGHMYVDDPRFTAHYEQRAEGLAVFVRDAILANADRAGH